MLSDPKKKDIYDKFGEDGLKSGGEGAGGPGGFHYEFQFVVFIVVIVYQNIIGIFFSH